MIPMKQLIKKIIPEPILHTALEFRDKHRLRIWPDLSFDATYLKQDCDLDLSAIFSDKEIEEMWHSDHKGIAALFRDDYTTGSINPGDRQALYYLITALKPLKILEVGTHIGASTLYIARALKNIANDANITTVDILDVNEDQARWKTLGLEMSPRDFANSLGCLDYINFIISSAQSFMKDTDKRFDFIFLDGDHSSLAVYKEVSIALTLLKPDGVILLHDYYPDAKPLFSDGKIIPGPFRAMDRIKRKNNNICVQPFGELPWPTRPGSNMTNLAVVTRKS